PIKIIELRRDSIQCAALKATTARSGPFVPAKSGRPVHPAVLGIDQRPVRFPAITEAIGKQEVDDFISPILGRGEEICPAWQRYRPSAVRTFASENIVGEAHGLPLLSEGETSHVMFTRWGGIMRIAGLLAVIVVLSSDQA